jgi:hypothetical protein
MASSWHLWHVHSWGICVHCTMVVIHPCVCMSKCCHQQHFWLVSELINLSRRSQALCIMLLALLGHAHSFLHACSWLMQGLFHVQDGWLSCARQRSEGGCCCVPSATPGHVCLVAVGPWVQVAGCAAAVLCGVVLCSTTLAGLVCVAAHYSLSANC